MTKADLSGPRPRGRGKRNAAHRGFRQGDLDGLCGVYSVVNALRAVAPELDDKLSARLFRHLVRCLRGRSREPLAVITGGIEYTVLVHLLRIAMSTLIGKVDSTFISVGILVMCLVIYIPMIRRSGFPAATYGLTLRNWKSSVRQSLLWTFLFLAALTLLKLIALQLVPAWRGMPLFSWYGFTRYPTLWQAFGLMAVYSLFSPVQEFIARGAMQSSLHEFLGGPRANLWAVLLSSLMFTQIHLHLTPGYAAAVFFPSLFWGAMYARQRSLVGVSLSHILIGVYVAFFLGLPMMKHA